MNRNILLAPAGRHIAFTCRPAGAGSKNLAVRYQSVASPRLKLMIFQLSAAFPIALQIMTRRKLEFKVIKLNQPNN